MSDNTELFVVKNIVNGTYLLRGWYGWDAAGKIRFFTRKCDAQNALRLHVPREIQRLNGWREHYQVLPVEFELP